MPPGDHRPLEIARDISSVRSVPLPRRVAAHRHESSVLIFGKDDDNHHPYQILELRISRLDHYLAIT